MAQANRQVSLGIILLILCTDVACIGSARAQGYLFEQEPGRHALVIGNANYKHLGPIPSAELDGERMTELLQKLGFTVTHVPDVPSVRTFEDEILPTFRKPIEPGDLVVFYFSGHGFSYGPTNFLAPIDLPVKVLEKELPRRAIAVEAIETYLTARSPGLLLFVIDACRNVAGSVMADDDNNKKFVHKGFAAPKEPTHGINTMAAFASRPGYTALGSVAKDQLSIFTSSMVSHINKEGYEFGRLFNDIGSDVKIATNEVQQPGLYDWSDTELYLRPSAAVLAEQKEAWVVALDSKISERIQKYTYRFSISRHAAAARKWLADNPPTGAASQFTLISPAAVERAWRPTKSRVAISPPATGFAFRRSLGIDAGTMVQVLDDGELGLVASGAARLSATASMIDREVQAILAHVNVVTTRDYVARTAPSKAAPMASRVPFGTLVSIHSVKDLGSEGIWFLADVPGQLDNVYLPVQRTSSETAPIELGLALREIVIIPRSSGIPDLVDPSGIGIAIAELKREGRTITWVSLATAATNVRKEADARAARRSHVEYLLKRAGIEGRRITAVANADDLSGSGVRLRFFGY